MIQEIKTTRGDLYSQYSDLTSLLELLLKFKESKVELTEEELMAVRLWGLQKCCELTTGEKICLYSTIDQSIKITAGRTEDDQVYINDSEDVIKSRAHEFFRAMFGR